MPQSHSATPDPLLLEPDWGSIMTAAGARPADAEADFCFADPAQEAAAAQDQGVVSPLLHLGALEFTGDDAFTFLHGQVSNAVGDLGPEESRLAAYCSPKGRSLALLRLLAVNGGLLALVHDRLAEAVRRRLQMFVLRSRVEIRNAGAELPALGVAGPAAETLLAENLGSPPRAPGAVTTAGDLRCLGLPDAGRYLVLGPADQIGPLWDTLARGLQPVGSAAWRLLDVRAGLPEVVPETSEHFVPLMLNLEALGGVSYSKGCYPGQEVVARMHSRGRLNRRMYRLAVAGPAPAPGSSVRTSEDREAGEVVISAATPEGRSEALAVLRIEEAGREDLQVDGTGVGVLELPYEV